MKLKRIMVVFNPESGQPEPVLKPVYEAIKEHGMEWEMAVSRSGEDLVEQVKTAGASGDYDAVAVYGGDGTIMAAAEALSATETPLVILPGGTGNVTAKELGVPVKPGEAMAFAASDEAEPIGIDLGETEQGTFLQRLVMGVEADMIRKAPREKKNTLGKKAYTVAFMKAVAQVPEVTYRLRIDGEDFEESGILCRVDNTSNYGMAGASMAPDVYMWDGYLDVFVVRHKDERALLGLLGQALDMKRLKKLVFHKKAQRVEIESSIPMRLAADGELWGLTPVSVKVRPAAVKIVGKKRAV